MAPISEKRLISTSPLKDNHHHHLNSGNHHQHHTQIQQHNGGVIFNHAKENASRMAGGNCDHAGNNKGSLEILDFHESWLEEMELYKGMYANKHRSHSGPLGARVSGGHSQGPMPNSIKSGSHNPHALEGGHLVETAVYQNYYGNSQSGANAGGGLSTGGSQLAKHKGSLSATAASVDHIKGGAKALHLKRTRDETNPSNKSPNNKRHISSTNSRPHAVTQGHNQLSAANAPVPVVTAVKNTGGGGSVLNTGLKGNIKIVVNQFHASSLLNNQQLEEKAKILTQNGLSKSAATAYETSLYASHYLPRDGTNKPGSAYNNSSLRSGINDNHNNQHSQHYPQGHHGVNTLGVHLLHSQHGVNGTGVGQERSHHQHHAHHNNQQNRGDSPSEDPAAAIDEVNSSTESDSEEEYVGQPFYLADDGAQTQQSRHVRDRPEPSVTSTGEYESETTDSCEYQVPKCILSESLFPNVPPYLNFSSHVHKGPAMPPALHKVLKWKLSPVMPKIVKRVVLNSGFRIIKNTTDWMAIWEKHMKSPGFRTIRSHQKYNHMPGSFRIGRKDSMWRSIHSNIKKYGHKEFGFMQRSFIMPDDLENLRQVWPKNASKLTKWIVKPPASARGTGIRIVNKWSQFPKDRPLVVQKYIERPLLINDSKFDMRIYVVLTSINPLRIYMHKDGLARFASVKYSSELTNLDDRCMHLTNYSINKLNQNYSKNEDFYACQGHKWTLQSLWSCLEKRGVNTKRLWATLRNLVIKAIISGEPGLNRMYRQNVNFRYNCFELFGFDVLLDENIVPWLLEINISPSLHSELPLDLHVKGPLIQAVLNTALYQVPPKLNEKTQAEILNELQLKGPLCHDKRIFTTCLTAEEVRKHNQFTNRSIEFREEYLDAILENLLPDDVRCLIITEDEFARCNPLERIFPTAETHNYLKYIENPRYYNRLLDAWENRYKHRRKEGIELLRSLCRDGYHLNVSDAALEQEPNVTLTEIDMLHVKKEDPSVAMTFDSNNFSTSLDQFSTSKANSFNTSATGVGDAR